MIMNTAQNVISNETTNSMNTLGFILITIISTIVLILILVNIWPTGEYSYYQYKRNTINQVTFWDKGSWKDFLREFNSRIWQRSSSGAYLDSKDDSYLHRTLVRFNTHGMLLSYWDWRRYKHFIEERLNPTKQYKGLWKRSEMEKALLNQINTDIKEKGEI